MFVKIKHIAISFDHIGVGDFVEYELIINTLEIESIQPSTFGDEESYMQMRSGANYTIRESTHEQLRKVLLGT